MMKKQKKCQDKKPNLTVLQKLLWLECRRIIKKRHGNTCYTCGRKCFGSNRHTGHGFAKAFCGLRMKYDLRNLRPQCYYCNIHLGGNGAVFFAKLMIENELEAQDIFSSVILSRAEEWTGKRKVNFISKLLQEYKKL